MTAIIIRNIICLLKQMDKINFVGKENVLNEAYPYNRITAAR